MFHVSSRQQVESALLFEASGPDLPPNSGAADAASATRAAFSAGRDAEGLLLAMMRGRPGLVIQVSSSAGHRWWVDHSSARVYGTSLHSEHPDLSEPLRFAMQAAGAAPETSRQMAFDQWIYWIARQATGAQLFLYRDELPLVVQRGVASASHGRDFARLMVAYGQPLTVIEASERTRVERAVVRRFLNAGLVLNRVSPATGPASNSGRFAVPALPQNGASESPVRVPVPGRPATAAPAVSQSLFSRLLRRIRGQA